MDLKIKAIEYFSSNNVLKELEIALQFLFCENAADYFGYLSKYFEQISQIPKLVKINLSRVFSNTGRFSTGLSVSVLWRTNTEVITRVKYIHGCSRCLTITRIPSVTSSSEFLAYVEKVEDRIRNCDWSPAEMSDVDKCLRKKPTKESIPMTPNQGISLAPLLATDFTWLSISLHLTAAKCSRPIIDFQQYLKSLYQEVIKSLNTNNESTVPPSTSLQATPCPIITILNCPGRIGALLQGKCRFLQEILLIPKPHTKPKELLDNLFTIKSKLQQILMNKSNLSPQMICENGASSVNIDKPEQALDLIIDCLEQLQLTEEFYLGLYISPKGIYDVAKERYEIITGMFKSPEEMVAFYADLLTRYSQIRLLIDPLRAEDKDNWETLKSRLPFPVLITASTTVQPAAKDVLPNRSTSVAAKSSTTTAGAVTTTTATTCETSSTFSIPTGPTIYDLLHSEENNTNVEQTDSAQLEDKMIDGEIQDTSIQQVDKQNLYFSAWLFTFDTCLDCVFITEIIQAIYKLHQQNQQVILSLDNFYASEDWPIDMAIALGINFIKFNGLNYPDKVDRLITWYEYYENTMINKIDSNSENQWRLYNPGLFEIKT
uniref:phosphopyruvate hydratase n=2 Tax=Trichobilharzia regenti TaxID=157069 RepID=A0AA85IU83_TRIRE|nr:unnamed protein product [Trichobilharzia regenti]